MSLVFATVFSIAGMARSSEQCNAGDGVLLPGTGEAPWAVQVLLQPETVPLNAPFDAIVSVCGKPDVLPTRLTFDAAMPAHKHGMNYEPKLAQIGTHRVKVENLVFHMPGIWRIEVTVYEGQTPHRFTHDMALK